MVLSIIITRIVPEVVLHPRHSSPDGNQISLKCLKETDTLTQRSRHFHICSY